MNRVHEFPPPTRITPETRRAIVCFRAESIEEKVDYTTWLNVWRDKMTFVSRDRGCGCCIHVFDLEGPQDAIEALPDSLLGLFKRKEGAHTLAAVRG